MPLSQSTLSALPASVRVPRYDRAALTPGIIHVGVGNFHRAHQAWYLQRVFDLGQSHDWAIIGAGVRPYDAVQREKLLAQDCLTTLIELAPTGTATEICGAMIDFVPVEEDNSALIAAMARPEIRIVSMTVTEGGYYRAADGSFDIDHADIQHDAENPDRPLTVFGAMVSALRQRREDGAGPFTGLSCDNLQGNGAVLRDAVVSLARQVDGDLAEWIDETCSFPNSMVDCIVPATGPEEIALARGLGIDDGAPVTHENYRQWVIEDDFCAGRPALDRAGATFSDQVHKYEAMKIRILNAGHQLIANPGEILSFETISDCMAHDLIAAYFRKVEKTEIAPHLEAVPGTTPEAYVDLIESRFANAAVVDQVRRVSFDGSSRHPGFVIPIIRDGLANGVPVEGLALAEAIWARMCFGTREDGSLIEANDPIWDSLTATAAAAKDRPMAWLEQSRIYSDLNDEPRFATAFETWLRKIWADGVEAALSAYSTA